MRLTLCCLEHTQLQTSEGFTSQLLQGAQRWRLIHGRRDAVLRAHRWTQVSARASTRVPENVCDAERREGFVRARGRRKSFQRVWLAALANHLVHVHLGGRHDIYSGVHFEMRKMSQFFSRHSSRKSVGVMFLLLNVKPLKVNSKSGWIQHDAHSSCSDVIYTKLYVKKEKKVKEIKLPDVDVGSDVSPLLLIGHFALFGEKMVQLEVP